MFQVPNLIHQENDRTEQELESSRFQGIDGLDGETLVYAGYK